MMLNADQRRTRLQSAFNELMAYHASGHMRMLIELLDAQIDEYKAELVNVEPGRLQIIQGATRQLIALRDSLADPKRNGLRSV